MFPYFPKSRLIFSENIKCVDSHYYTTTIPYICNKIARPYCSKLTNKNKANTLFPMMIKFSL